MIRLFCTDFDNTLSRKGRICDANLAAVSRLRENGVEFAVVTGRMISNINAIVRERGFDAHTVGTNGSIAMEKAKELIFEDPIPESVLRGALDACKKRGWLTLVYDKDTCYLTKDKFWFPGSRPLARLIGRKLNAKVVFYDGGYDGSPFSRGAQALKLNVVPGLRNMEEAFRVLGEIEGAYVTSSSHRHIELMNADTDKWNGITALANRLGIAPEEIAAIGDFCNDLPMIRNAGMGFAVGNAHDEVLEAADYRVAGCSEGGFAEAVDIVLRENASGGNKG